MWLNEEIRMDVVHQLIRVITTYIYIIYSADLYYCSRIIKLYLLVLTST